MADGIYVGMAAASARAAQLDSIADNLANMETPGFKAARPAFASFLPKGGGQSDKVFAAAVATGIDMRPGTTVATDNPMDVLPEGNLFLGVESPSGAPAYTRNGKLQMSPDGQLQVMGNAVLNAGGSPINVPMGAMPTINEKGEVIADGAVIDTIGLFNIQGPVDRNGAGMLTLAAGTTADPVTDGKLMVGTLEMGNATPLESMVAMIGSQRQFETAMQAIQTYKNLDGRATEVGRIK